MNDGSAAASPGSTRLAAVRSPSPDLILERAALLEPAAAIRAIEAESGPLFALVNNAGYGRFGKITELDAEGESNEIAVNVNALMRLSRAALVAMAPRTSGGAPARRTSSTFFTSMILSPFSRTASSMDCESMYDSSSSAISF